MASKRPVALVSMLAVATALSPLPQTAHAQAAKLCDASAVAAAFRTRDIRQLEEVYRASQVAGSRCAPKVTYCTGRLIGIAYRDQANASAAAKTLGELDAILKTGKRFGAPWQLLAAEGEIAFAQALDGDKPAYGRAARSLELAMNDLAEDPPCAEFGEPGPPPPVQIAKLHKKMEEAKLLAPGFELVRTRDGECGGVFLKNIRGYEPKSTPVPIEFEYNSVTMTAKGQRAAEGLKECIAARQFPRVHLTGHTDKTGSDAFNMDLSSRRLQAIKQFLVDGGYGGTIELEPKGKREPYSVDDPTQHSEADIDQMNRRVVLKDASK
jgi:outer membrane protein OmpA-like peptidoglycan-associated protein